MLIHMHHHKRGLVIPLLKREITILPASCQLVKNIPHYKRKRNLCRHVPWLHLCVFSHRQLSEQSVPCSQRRTASSIDGFLLMAPQRTHASAGPRQAARQAGKETSRSEELYAAVCRRARVWLLKCLLEKNLNIYIINSPSHLIIPVTLLSSSLLFASPAFKHGTSCAEGDIFQKMFLSKSLNSSFDNLTLTH